MHVSNNPLLSQSACSGSTGEALFRPRTLRAVAAFEYNGGLHFWTVPESGMYRITARGAKAADGHHKCAL